MRTFINELVTQMRGIWARLEGPQRLVVSVVVLATMIGLGAIVWFAGRPSYETVYVARDSEELNQVAQALQSAGISWNEDGMGFQVERSKVGQARQAIAKGGILGPQRPDIGGTGSLIEDAATKAYRLDLAARQEAAMAIEQLEGVASATVTFSRPRRSVAFRDRQEEQTASATVLLRLHPGASFEDIADSAARIASATLMVPKKNIDVVSSTGRRWRYDPDRGSSAGSSDFLALQRNLSDTRTQMAQDRLDQIWPGKTSVNVTVELDPSWEVRHEKLLPDKKTPRSEDLTKDSSEPGANPDSGAPGRSKNEVRNVEYVTDIGERRTGKMMPEIRRISVAVCYDEALQINEDELGNTVKAIVGWDDQRNDTFSVMKAPFPALEEAPVIEGESPMAEMIQRWAPTIGQVLGVLVVVMFLRGLFRRTPSRAAAPATIGAMPVGAAAVAAGPVEVPEENLTPEEQQRRMRREIERSIAQDPAALAKMLEAWLLEQKV